MWAFCILRSRGVHPSITLSTKLRRNSIRWTPNRHTRYKSANPTWRVKYASIARYDDMAIFVLRGPQARRHLAHHDGQTKRGLQCAAMLNTLPRRRSHKNRRHFADNPDKCVKDLRRRLVLTVVLGIVDRWLAYCQYIKPHINSTASTFDKNKMSAGGPTKHRTGPHWHTGPTHSNRTPKMAPNHLLSFQTGPWVLAWLPWYWVDHVGMYPHMWLKGDHAVVRNHQGKYSGRLLALIFYMCICAWRVLVAAARFQTGSPRPWFPGNLQ